MRMKWVFIAALSLWYVRPVLGLENILTAYTVLQGNAALIQFPAIKQLSDIAQVTFNGKSMSAFSYRGVSSVLIGIDLNQKPGAYVLVTKLKNKEQITQGITVQERVKPQETLGIPQKLGGNTRSAQSAFINSLASENAALAKLRTGAKTFWSAPFAYPLANATVTDPFGYIRQTGSYQIAHKGTDFRAPEGTPVFAMNRGVVRLARNFRVYGKTIVVDHGLGVMTLFMHLSKINVNVGELVEQGQIIGLAGESGYAEAPHLHMSVRINGVSVDPIAFLKLFAK